MNHSSDAIRPHAVWYVAGLVVLFAGMGLARWQIASGKSTLKDKSQSVRGSATIQIKQAGSHSVYVRRGASQRMDAAADRAWKTARGAVVTVRDERAGSELSVRNTYETMDMQNNLLARLVEFDVPEAGSYTVRIEPSLDALSPSVGPTVPVDQLRQEMTGFLMHLFIGLGIGALSVIVSLVICIVVFVRRRNCRKRLGEEFS